MYSSSKLNSNISLSYIINLCIVTFTQYGWLPWLIIHLHSRKYYSWIHTVPAYGMLLSCLKCGQYIGQVIVDVKRMNSIWFYISFISLMSAYIFSCFVTRYSLIMYSYICIGIFGSIFHLDNINKTSSSTSLSSSTNITFHSKSNEQDISNLLERRLVTFSFVILLSGYLYNDRFSVQFPLHRIAILSLILCIFNLIHYQLINKILYMKMKSTTSSSSLSQSNMMKSSNNISSSSSSSKSRMNTYNNITTTTASHTNGDSTAAEQVDKYHGLVPSNFLSACNGNLINAQKMYSKMLAWRKKYQVDEILDIPQDHFHTILQYYPHAIHGYSLDGCAVVYEILGKGKLSELKKTVDMDQLVWHFALRNELVFKKLMDPIYMQSILQGRDM